MVHFTFNIPPTINVTNMIDRWLNEIDKERKAQIRMGVCAMLWAISNYCL